MKRTKINLPFKLIAFYIIILLALGSCIGYIWVFLARSDLFKVKDIITKDINAAGLSYLKGKNIFSIDLRAEADRILQYYPEARRINIVRILPDRLFVGAVKRRPIAFVKLYRYFALDENGILFYTLASPEQLELPVIVGLETKIFGPKSGKKYDLKEVALAVVLIRELKKSRVLRNYKIAKIDVSSAENSSVSLLLPQKLPDPLKGQEITLPLSLEVKIGQDNIREKVAVLSGVVIQTLNDLSSIKYIDLRFRDPVIKFKDAKSK